MEDKKFKRLMSQNDLLVFFFKNHPISPQTKARNDKLNYAFRQIKDEERVSGAINALFYHVPAHRLAFFEEKSPQTVKRLFIVAEDLLAGKFGSIGVEAAKTMTNLLFQEKILQKLMLIDLLLSDQEAQEWPEVLLPLADDQHFKKMVAFLSRLNPEQLGEQIFSSDKLDSLVETLFWRRETYLAIEQLLRKYLSNLLNPSHVAVDLLIEHEEPIEKSVKVVEQIKNPTEKSKSLVSIIKRLMQTNRIEKALDTVRSIQVDKVRTKPLVQLIDQLLNPSRSQFEKMLYANQVEQAIGLAKNVKDVIERDKILQKIAYTLAKKDQLHMAEEVTALISNKEGREASLSSIVNALSSIHRYKQAKILAASIKDQDFREDAYSYIVKALLLDHQIDEAIAFVESIENSIERSKAAKILLSSFISHHDLERSDQIREKFELVRQRL
ncbi:MULTISPECIES: hypothetical protein [Parachlamydia]|uniref:hypothetical protein n=1 Tax=Parachlamydia TaxID=83551 RepID=UPI0001C17867|nr:hypothetical protein [Parachlamydia acanthamoebae]EFB42264.1 hypothetical protein pah_c013o027 [Parachlamydia acanthamoebae str. Hall's coccus]